MILETALTLFERCDTPQDIRAACAEYFDVLRPTGLNSFGARAYLRPAGRLDSSALFAAGGSVVAIAPDGWIGSQAYRYICLEQNPLLAAVQERRARFRWSDYAPRDDRGFGTYWEAFGEGGFGDGLGMISFGRGRRTASLSLGFTALDLAPREIAVIQFAGMMLLERLLEHADPGADDAPVLTPRERDCLAFVAEGKSDWEIGKILSISQATAHSHVENAKRKLGARTRAQAVARFFTYGLN
jgi:DNA-binding CsgD family transcriptional regulator